MESEGLCPCFPLKNPLKRVLSDLRNFREIMLGNTA